MEIACNYLAKLAEGYQMIKPYIGENLKPVLSFIGFATTGLGIFGAGWLDERGKELNDLSVKLQKLSK